MNRDVHPEHAGYKCTAAHFLPDSVGGHFGRVAVAAARGRAQRHRPSRNRRGRQRRGTQLQLVHLVR